MYANQIHKILMTTNKNKPNLIIVNICDNWLCDIENSENRNCIVALFLEFKRVFETFDHNILMKKFKKYGYTECPHLSLH